MLAATACSSDGEEYPNLNTVPTSPGSSDSLAEARKIEEGLIADRENARYTDEILRADTSVQAPLTPPPPKVEVEEAKEEVAEQVVQQAPEPEEKVEVTETVTETETTETATAEDTEKTDDSEEVASAAVPAQSAASAASSTEAAPAPAPATVEEAEADADAAAAAQEEEVSPPPAETAEVIEKEVEKVEEAQTAASEAPAVQSAPAAAPASAPEPATSATAVAEETEVAAIAEDTLKGVPGYRELVKQPPLETIFFEQGSNRITAEDSQKLTRIAQSQLADGGRLKIVGHASSRTRELSASEHMIANLKASQQRAAAVAQALIALGVSSDDLILESVSDSFPLTRGGRPSDEAKNRRAEIFLLN